MATITIKKSSIEEIKQELANKRAGKNFASRKTNTKKFAIKHNLYLPLGEKSIYDDNIDWTAAIKQKYDTTFEVWSDIHWKSKKVSTRNLKDMTDEEYKSYKNAASRKCRFNAQLKITGVSLDDFLTHICVNEAKFFSDEYQDEHKVTKGNKVSVYNLEYWLDTIMEIMPE